MRIATNICFARVVVVVCLGIWEKGGGGEGIGCDGGSGERNGIRERGHGIPITISITGGIDILCTTRI